MIMNEAVVHLYQDERKYYLHLYSSTKLSNGRSVLEGFTLCVTTGFVLHASTHGNTSLYHNRLGR
jgi:hypothetical protein